MIKLVWAAKTTTHLIGQIQLEKNKSVMQFLFNKRYDNNNCRIRIDKSKNHGLIKEPNNVHRHKVIKDLILVDHDLPKGSRYYTMLYDFISNISEEKVIDCTEKFNRRITQEELDYVRENSHKPVIWLSEKLKRTPNSIVEMFQHNEMRKHLLENSHYVSSRQCIDCFNDTRLFEKLTIKARKIKNVTGYYKAVDIYKFWDNVELNRDKISVHKIDFNHELMSSAPRKFIDYAIKKKLETNKDDTYTKITQDLVAKVKYYKYTRGYTRQEIADALNIKHNTVKYILKSYVYKEYKERIKYVNS